MKKTIYIIISIVLAIVLSIIAYLIFFAKNTPLKNTAPTKTNGGALPIGDIKNIPGAQRLSDNDTLVQSTTYFDIVYFDFGANDRSFLISIKNPAVEAARQEAEAAFLRDLQITREQACQLNVSLRVSKDANENLAGQEFGLSFCPNGKPFSQK